MSASTTVRVSVPAAGRPLCVSDFLAYAMLLSMPMVNVFAPSPWLIPPMTIGLALTAWLFHCKEILIDRRFAVLLVLIAVCFVPWLGSAEYISYKTAFHAAAIIGSATVYYLAMRTALINLVRKGAALGIVRAVYIALFAVSLFILVEFVGSNTGAWDVGQFIPYATVPELEAQILGFILRSRGFASEPGVMALYYDFVLFFVLPMLKLGWRYRIGYVFVIVPAYLCLFSTSSLVGVAISATALLVWRFRSHFVSSTLRVAALVGVVMVMLVAWQDEVADVAETLIVSKISSLVAGSGEDSSGNLRRSRFEQVAEVATDYPTGIGFGVTPGLRDAGVKFRGLSLEEGQISLFATFLLSGGVFALLLLTSVVGVSIYQALKIPLFGPYIAAGGLAISLHHLTVTEFWLPFFWFFLACVSAYHHACATGNVAQRLTV
jgi:hypothetical protein